MSSEKSSLTLKPRNCGKRAWFFLHMCVCGDVFECIRWITWIHLCYWYEGAAPFNPSTNNGLEV
jgi:hypothetical protein